MCDFISYFMPHFSYYKIENTSAFVTQTCLFSSFAFRFSLVNYFFALSLVVFKSLFYYNFFVILNDTIKVSD